MGESQGNPLFDHLLTVALSEVDVMILSILCSSYDPASKYPLSEREVIWRILFQTIYLQSPLVPSSL
jgi:hypothetical protein